MGKTDHIQVKLDKLREDYRIGRESILRAPFEQMHKGHTEEASKYGKGQESLRQLRKLADAKIGYSQQEFEQMLDHCIRTGNAIGIKHLVLLLLIPKGAKRERLQHLAIENAWSASKLAKAVRKPPSKTALGRKRDIPDDPLQLLNQIASECDRWQRYACQVLKVIEAKEVPSRYVSAKIERQIRHVADGIARLINLVYQQ